ncbi:MAG: PepSY-associated TM helix domain-containing protein [Pseudomonadales bacterium]
MLRKALFWMHLATGVAVGLVVLMMSATGVILTYERQILDATAQKVAVPADGTTLPLSDLVRTTTNDGFEPTHLTLHADPSKPLELRAGRSGSRLIDPYTGERLTAANRTLDAFFAAVTRWHRWFDAGDDERATARAITGGANLAFLFLLLSGAWLWLPGTVSRATFRRRLWFTGARTAAQRDYTWHHVIGFWSLLPLVVIVATGTVFGYGWANRLAYNLAGEEPPVRSAPGPAGQHASAPVAGMRPGPADALPLDTLPLEMLLARAVDAFEAELGPWNAVTVTLPETGATRIQFQFDQGTGGQPQRRHGLTLEVARGDLLGWSRFQDQSVGTRLRSWIRFLHTGEALGFAGQTVAGVASLGAVFMVWTGLSLSLRRFRRYQRRRLARTSIA